MFGNRMVSMALVALVVIIAAGQLEAVRNVTGAGA